jgi:proteasome accessory factor C
MSRPGAKERLVRLLAIVPWIASHDGPRVEEVCARFGIGEADLLADLDLLFLCGVHPFTPDTLIEVDVADGRVWIRFADWFRRPLRLTASEGLALVAAGEALVSTPGGDPDGALSGALTKLREVLELPADDAVEVELGPAADDTLAAIRRALAEGRKLELDYYSFGRDARSRRVVQPWRLFAAAGAWYLAGWCETAAAERLFRLDRIHQARVLDAPAERPAPPATPTPLFRPAADTTRVVLELAPDARWIAERYPNEGVEELPGGVWRVRLAVAEQAWLERILLRAGPSARVVTGDPSAQAAAATRVLARYRPRPPSADPLG